MSRPTTTPDWMEGKTPPDTNITEPSAEKKALGFLPGEKPPADYFNWLLWIKNKWIKFIDTVLSAQHNDSGEHKTITLAGSTNKPSIANSGATDGGVDITSPGNATGNVGLRVFNSSGTGFFQIGAGNDSILMYALDTDFYLMRNAYYEGGSFYKIDTSKPAHALKFSEDGTTRFLYDSAGIGAITWDNDTYINSLGTLISSALTTTTLTTNGITLAGSTNKPSISNSGGTNGSADVVFPDVLGVGLRIYTSGTAPKQGFLQVGTGKAGLLTYATESVTYILKNATFDGTNFSTVDAATPSFGLIFSDTDSTVEIVSRPAGAGSWTTWPSKTYLLNTSGDSLHYGKKTIERSSGTDEVIVTKIASDTQNRHTLDANGKQEWGAGGTSARDTNLYRNAADELKTDDKFTSALGFLAGSGYFYEQPDVAGGTANDGKFLGGNGGFMWFYGVTTGTTEIVLDSSINWRDKFIYVVGFVRNESGDTPSNYIPNGASDGTISGLLKRDSGGITLNQLSVAFFYSENGSSDGSYPCGKLCNSSIESDEIQIYAKSSNGNLAIKTTGGMSVEAAYNLLVVFSNDMGFY